AGDPCWSVRVTNPRSRALASTQTGADRRQHPRLCVSLPVELKDLKSSKRVTGIATNISAGGGYVEGFETLLTGTQIEILLMFPEREFRCNAYITYVSTNGMGIAFNGANLLDWFDENADSQG